MFHGVGTQISLPSVRGTTNHTVRWDLVLENGSAATVASEGREGTFVELNDARPFYRTHFNIFPSTQETATVRFRASIFTDGSLHTTRYYNVTIQYLRTNTFDGIFSPNQTGRAAYRTQGIARERVFGLWDIVHHSNAAPAGAVVYPTTASRFPAAGVRGYVRSGDVMELGWLYSGEVYLRAELLDHNGYPVANPNEDLVVSMNVVSDTRIEIGFLDEGERTVRVSGWTAAQDPNNDEPSAVYQYTYVIRDAVNAHNIIDLKELEFNARVRYIIDGVDYFGGVGQMFAPITEDTRFTSVLNNVSLGATPEERAFNRFVPRPNAELNSERFNTMQFRWQGALAQHAHATFVFEEFRRWAPTFRYKDIVIRDNMKTLEEGTWFFGSVFGNGFQIDATPYAENTHEHILQGVERTPAAGAYRNVFGTGWNSHGFEGLPKRVGSGWGQVYAFYMAANETIMCNITLTGWNRTNPDGTPARLSDFNTLSVVGVPNLGGGAQNAANPGVSDFMIGHAHANGVFHTGRYIADIRFQNSIFEKGLVLVGIHHAPNAERPVVVDTSVLRYSGFTAVYGLGIMGPDGSLGNINVERGNLVRNNNTMGAVNGVNYSNHILLRNITIYEITTIPVVLDDTAGGSFVQFEGENNNLLTWLRMTDLVFPIFKAPGLPFYDGTFVPGITNIAQGLVQSSVAANPSAIVPDGHTFWINIPILSVASGVITNSWNWDNTNIVMEAAYPRVGIDIIALFLDFYFTPAGDIPGVISQERQLYIFEQPGELARLIQSKNITLP